MLGCGHYRVFDEAIEILPEQRREVLSCQTTVIGPDAEIFLPHASVIAFDGARIADEMDIPDHVLNPRFPEGFGVAVDVGTTTVVAALINLENGRVTHRASLYNQQILKAADVVSRISLCNTPSQLEVLQELVIHKTLNPLILKLCADSGINKDEMLHLTVSGNTVMTHIFFGVSPVSMGTLPFDPVSRTFVDTASARGIDINPTALIQAIPAISGYIGGDITSDIFASKLQENGGLSVLIDIGTNGEIVANLDGKMTACSTAAGPAFEGAGLLHGTRAASRAIDSIQYDRNLDFKLTIIDEQTPMGLCGSAIIDFIAEGFRCGLINSMGRYDIELLKKKQRYESVYNMHACILVPAEQSATGKSITVTEGDIAEILKAKAAIYGGLKSLLTELGRTAHKVDHLILSGGFAKHINIRNAITLGLLPDISPEKYQVIGNGSLAGATLALLDKDVGRAYLELIDKPRVITLNQTPHFLNYFQEALAIPNLETDDFPSVTP